jgi:hypothetical protein
MDGTINKIVILTDYPYNQQYAEYFGVELLRNHGLEVEIWDISAYLFEKFRDQLLADDPKKFEGLRLFFRKNEIEQAISCQNNRCFFNCFIGYSLSTFFIFRAISNQCICYCVPGMVSFPSPHPVRTHFVQRIVSQIKNADSLKFKGIIEHILNKFLLNYYFLFGIAPAAVLLLNGEKSGSVRPLYPIDRKTTLLWTHSFDYDVYLKNQQEITSSDIRAGVFLDDYLPLHPDFLFTGVEFSISPEDYYRKLCNFFSSLEQQALTKVLIAAHPKSDYDNAPDYFCGRTIVKGKTASMVREAAFAIAHMSTSINFAVLYHKPIIFVTMDEIEKMSSGKNITGLYIQAIAAALGKTPVNIDHEIIFKWDKEMEINEAAYSHYRNLYIKKRGTPEKPMWEIFYSWLRENPVS